MVDWGSHIDYRREQVPTRMLCPERGWFASLPASTQPNRLYVHSGTSHGATSNIASLLAKGYPQRTIFENVHDAGLSFGIYYQNIPSTMFYRNLRKLKYLNKFHLFGRFKQDARQGKLPNYVVLEPRYFDLPREPGNDDHPSHDVYQGQMFVKEVYETLRASPQWNETLFIITYDEHGGYYDHVPTPVISLADYRNPTALVSDFAVFDRWFASAPTSMLPNRLYIHTGTSAGATSNIPPFLGKGYPQRTIFENLDDARMSFGIYFQNLPPTLAYGNLWKLKYIRKFHLFDLDFKRHAN
ncbi:non-specific phospholipase C2-like [Cucurbita pepo subsp. pepo]|uniref:non-specific phospholipase C2-like n=1 Tax=Cucurbita pepo subsp. pepo TaxID=3664 RepID=UPI000C9D52E0|nr:non-specific phospholipase C2-like [Cucurbita pepo subsp. pepo]